MLHFVFKTVVFSSIFMFSFGSKFEDSKIESARNAISSLIDNISEKHYARFTFVVTKNDIYFETLATKVMKKISYPVELEFIEKG
jgi:hypothetical protein